MYRLQRKLLSQNFLRQRKLVKKLIRRSSITPTDLVLEIGPGKGIITEELLTKAGRVIAVELDREWHRYLQHKFERASGLRLVSGDFLAFPLPRQPYKVFANMPFSIGGRIIRKLIDDPYPPEDCYLVTQQELAYRLSGRGEENMFTVMHKPFFDFSIDHTFHPYDFEPVPKVRTVLFRFTKKKLPIIPWLERHQYQRFVETGYGQGLAVFKNLQRMAHGSYLSRSFDRTSISRRAKPGHLSLEQWVDLYNQLGRNVTHP